MEKIRKNCLRLNCREADQGMFVYYILHISGNYEFELINFFSAKDVLNEGVLMKLAWGVNLHSSVTSKSKMAVDRRKSITYGSTISPQPV